MNALTINKGNRGNEISPMLYGIFFEDINYGGDGGLYGELIANRSFNYYDREGKRELSSLCWEVLDDNCGIVNRGYNGEGFFAEKGKEYILRVQAQAFDESKVVAVITDDNGNSLGEANILLSKSDEFIFYKVTIKVEENFENARLALILPEGGDVEFKYVSLFPKETFCNRENGMRKDLAEKLLELHPKFMRFPGGCIVEGRSFSNMYNWKDTVGPVHERMINYNRWQFEEYQQEGRDSSDYFQSYGIGFFEYFQLCEDLGAEPLPVINCGMTCQWHEALLTPMEELDSFIKDAIDLVEFANGDKSTNWGRVRAQMGHEEPFGLKYIGIGNEQWGPSYFERYEAFERVLSERCPDIKLITCAGWNSEGQEFDQAYEWMKAKKCKAYAVDEHFYKSPEWFLENVHRYDDYDRSLPKVFAGEYAAHTSEKINERRNNLKVALAEAAFLTGVEKNADHVVMTSYAPLFAKANHQQWQPDLIWFNNKTCFGSPSYYVQKLFSEFCGQVALKIDNISELEEAGLYVSVSLASDKTIVKIVNLSGEKRELKLDAADLPEEVEVRYIGGALEDENSFEEPLKVSIKSEKRKTNPLQISENEILTFTF